MANPWDNYRYPKAPAANQSTGQLTNTPTQPIAVSPETPADLITGGAPPAEPLPKKQPWDGFVYSKDKDTQPGVFKAPSTGYEQAASNQMVPPGGINPTLPGSYKPKPEGYAYGKATWFRDHGIPGTPENALAFDSLYDTGYPPTPENIEIWKHNRGLSLDVKAAGAFTSNQANEPPVFFPSRPIGGLTTVPGGADIDVNRAKEIFEARTPQGDPTLVGQIGNAIANISPSINEQYRLPVEKRTGLAGVAASAMPEYLGAVREDLNGVPHNRPVMEHPLWYGMRLLNAPSAAIASSLETLGEVTRGTTETPSTGSVIGDLTSGVGLQEFERNLARSLGRAEGLTELGSKTGAVIEKEHPTAGAAATAIGTGVLPYVGMKAGSAGGRAAADKAMEFLGYDQKARDEYTAGLGEPSLSNLLAVAGFMGDVVTPSTAELGEFGKLGKAGYESLREVPGVIKQIPNKVSELTSKSITEHVSDFVDKLIENAPTRADFDRVLDEVKSTNYFTSASPSGVGKPELAPKTKDYASWIKEIGPHDIQGGTLGNEPHVIQPDAVQAAEEANQRLVNKMGDNITNPPPVESYPDTPFGKLDIYDDLGEYIDQMDVVPGNRAVRQNFIKQYERKNWLYRPDQETVSRPASRIFAAEVSLDKGYRMARPLGRFAVIDGSFLESIGEAPSSITPQMWEQLGVDHLIVTPRPIDDMQVVTGIVYKMINDKLRPLAQVTTLRPSVLDVLNRKQLAIADRVIRGKTITADDQILRFGLAISELKNRRHQIPDPDELMKGVKVLQAEKEQIRLDLEDAIDQPPRAHDPIFGLRVKMDSITKNINTLLSAFMRARSSRAQIDRAIMTLSDAVDIYKQSPKGKQLEEARSVGNLPFTRRDPSKNKRLLPNAPDATLSVKGAYELGEAVKSYNAPIERKNILNYVSDHYDNLTHISKGSRQTLIKQMRFDPRGLKQLDLSDSNEATGQMLDYLKREYVGRLKASADKFTYAVEHPIDAKDPMSGIDALLSNSGALRPTLSGSKPSLFNSYIAGDSVAVTFVKNLLSDVASRVPGHAINNERAVEQITNAFIEELGDFTGAAHNMSYVDQLRYIYQMLNGIATDPHKYGVDGTVTLGEFDKALALLYQQIDTQDAAREILNRATDAQLASWDPGGEFLGYLSHYAGKPMSRALADEVASSIRHYVLETNPVNARYSDMIKRIAADQNISDPQPLIELLSSSHEGNFLSHIWSQYRSGGSVLDALNTYQRMLGTPDWHERLVYALRADGGIQNQFKELPDAIKAKPIKYFVDNLSKLGVNEDVIAMLRGVEHLIKGSSSVLRNGLTGGVGVPNIPYHIANFLTAPAIVYQQLGLGPTLGAVSNLPWGSRLMGHIFDHRIPLPDGKPILAGPHKNLSWDDIRDIILNNNIQLSQSKFEFSTDVLTDMIKRMPNQKGWKQVLEDLIGTNGPTIWNEFANVVDGSWRAGVLLSALREGKDIPTAVKLARAALFDYGSTTNFEKNTAAKFLWFYSFWRHNLVSAVGLMSSPKGATRIKNALKLIYTPEQQERPEVGNAIPFSPVRPPLGKASASSKYTMYGPEMPVAGALDEIITMISAVAHLATSPGTSASMIKEEAAGIAGMNPYAGLATELFADWNLRQARPIGDKVEPKMERVFRVFDLVRDEGGYLEGPAVDIFNLRKDPKSGDLIFGDAAGKDNYKLLVRGIHDTLLGLARTTSDFSRALDVVKTEPKSDDALLPIEKLGNATGIGTPVKDKTILDYIEYTNRDMYDKYKAN